MAPPSRNRFVLPVVVSVGLVTLAAANYFISSAARPNGDDKTASPAATTASREKSAAVSPAVRQTPLPDQNYLENPQGAAQRMQRLARETGGDWNKLAPDDKRLFDSVTLGRGREMLRTQAEQLKKEARRGKVTPPPLRK